jgi:hypothetical protein
MATTSSSRDPGNLALPSVKLLKILEGKGITVVNAILDAVRLVREGPQ